MDKSTVLITHAAFSALDVFYIPFGIFYFVNKQYLLCTVTDTCGSLSWDNYFEPEILVMVFVMLVQIPVFTLLILIADVLKNGGSIKSIFVSLEGLVVLCHKLFCI